MGVIVMELREWEALVAVVKVMAIQAGVAMAVAASVAGVTIALVRPVWVAMAEVEMAAVYQAVIVEVHQEVEEAQRSDSRCRSRRTMHSVQTPGQCNRFFL